VTPYLVRPVSSQLALPTDGYRAPNDAQGFLGGQVFTGVSGAAGRVPPVAAVAVPSGPAAAPGFKL
jgi:pilus assembly protein CpaC